MSKSRQQSQARNMKRGSMEILYVETLKKHNIYFLSKRGKWISNTALTLTKRQMQKELDNEQN